MISGLAGFAHGVVLDRLGVDLAALFGLLSFGLNFIPTIGLLVATLLPAPLVYLAPIDSLSKVLAMLIPYAVQLVVSNFLEPAVFGNRSALAREAM